MAPVHRLRRRVAVVSGLTLAALSVPVAVALSGTTTETTSATGQCLAWFGSREDGQCIGYSNGNATSFGTPQLGVYGPGYGGGLGVTTGPLLPGQTINTPIGGTP